MKWSIAGAVSLLSAVAQVTAWGPRGGKDGPPGHCNSGVVHGADFQPDHILRVTYGNHSVGCQTRESVLINGTSPGPKLRLKPGQRSWIRVYNDMCEEKLNTTMHWHGLSMRLAPFSDGTPQASQWPIPPCHFFDYEIFPLKKEAGTYFYHSHVGFQAISADGPLIIEDLEEPPYQYDDERTIEFQDYYNKTDDVIEKGLVASPFKWSGEVNAVLINGVGVANGEKAGSGTCQLPVIEVEPDKTYRFRFIGGTAISMVQFAIDSHDNFTIIEADGSYTKPHREEHMQLGSGQRFSALFKTKSLEELNGKYDYIIQFETKNRPAVYRGYGVLRYKGGTPSIITAPEKPPMTLTNATYDWAEYALQPLKDNNFPKAEVVTRRIEIDSFQFGSAKAKIGWHLNDLSWNETAVPYPDDTPYLINLYENGPDAMPDYEAAQANKGWDPKSLTFPAKLGEVIEIIWYNTGGLVDNNGGQDFHPYHAHGGHFYDIGSGNGTYNATLNEQKLANYNPVLRDTTNLYQYAHPTIANTRLGWRGWRLRVEDAGVWMVHCHVLQHMVMGMQSVWVMGDYEDITRIPLADAEGYLKFGGSAFGNETWAPRVNHFFDGWDEEDERWVQESINDVPR